MQSPVLHQLSSLRDSLPLDDHHNALNYRDLPGPSAAVHSGLHPRASSGTTPLSSLASSSGGGNILASTILDIPATPTVPASSSSDSVSSQAQPQSKSDQDLARY